MTNRLDTLRKLADPTKNCDHLRVNVCGIERPWSLETKSRLLRGDCQACGGTVRREQTAGEIATGTPATTWK